MKLYCSIAQANYKSAMTGLLSTILLIGLHLNMPQTAKTQIIQTEPPQLENTQTNKQQEGRLFRSFYIKAGIVAVGLGLISVELWWFLLGKTKGNGTQKPPKK